MPQPDFPYPLTAISGEKAIEQWRILQASWREEGCSAVLVGDAKEAALIGENFQSSEVSVESLLQVGAQLRTVLEFFKKRLTEDKELYAGVDRGVWPVGGVAVHRLSAHLDLLTRQPKDTVYFAKIPTRNSFEIPVYLKYGGWNECPSAAEHMAILRRWSKQFGVEIYAMLGDFIECEVATPPTDRESAISLAGEQFVYCSDIVFQGTRTLLALAAALKDSEHWFFWWD